MMRIKAILFVVLLMIVTEAAVGAMLWQVAIYNVKKFGAKGDGVTDDTHCLQQCMDAALQKGGVVEVPEGDYKVTGEVLLNFKSDVAVTIKGISGKRKPRIFTDNFTNIIIALSDPNAPKGRIVIENLEVQGNNVPFSGSHPYYGKKDYKIGIGVSNLKEAVVKNNIVSRIYGEGIYVCNWNFEKNRPENRFRNIEIVGNQVLNCWGLHPNNGSGAFDDYGDGIYVNNVAKGLISGNQVINDLRTTKQFGRAGLVVEFNAENCSILNNRINGYDRNIHFEGDYGGHVLKGNRLTGSDFGICVYSNAAASAPHYPLVIANNYVSNENIPSGLRLQPIRSAEERALISFYAEHDNRINSTISNNTLKVTGNSGRINKTVVRIAEDDLYLNGNIYSSDIKDTRMKPAVYYYKQLKNITNESYYNLNIVFSGTAQNKVKNSTAVRTQANNKLFNSVSNIGRF